MAENRVIDYAEKLSGISLQDWKQLKIVVDRCFEKKRIELEMELRFDSVDDVRSLTRSQFG